MLLEQIDKDLVQSLKDKDEIKVSVLRLLKSAIKNWQIANQKEPVDTDVADIIAKEIKARRDSIKMYQEGNREDLAKKENAEIEILQKYLPEQMGEEEIRTRVKEVIAEQGAQNIQDMGKVMGVLMGELKGKADGSTISSIVKDELSK